MGASPYIQGFLLAVPTANKDAYQTMAASVNSWFKEYGMLRQVEAWGDDVPDGKINDMKVAVKAKPEETIVFAWLEYPDRATCDGAHDKMMSDPRMKDPPPMPFDGQRMIFGGFAPLIDTSKSTPGRATYIDGTVVAVPTANKAAYTAAAQLAASALMEHGALRVCEGWGDNVPDGKQTDFKRAVLAKADESVAFGFVEWPSKAVRDAAWPKLFADPRMHPGKDALPYDGARRILGGFVPMVDE